MGSYASSRILGRDNIETKYPICANCGEPITDEECIRIDRGLRTYRFHKECVEIEDVDDYVSNQDLLAVDEQIDDRRW